jgi:ADP-heptose:LPS heptosyltransferase
MLVTHKAQVDPQNMQNDQKEQSADKKTVFVVRLSAIGDALIAARSLLRLAAEGFDPVFCTSRACADVALTIPNLHRAIIVEKDRSLSFVAIRENAGQREFCSESYETLFPATESLWPQALLDLQGTRRSARFIKELRQKISPQVLHIFKVEKHALARILMVVRARFSFKQQTHNTNDGLFTPEIGLRRVALHNQKVVEKFLMSQGRPTPQPGIPLARIQTPRIDLTPYSAEYVVFCPGASLPLKAWGSANYKRCAEKILANSNAHIVVLGGPDEAETGAEIQTLSAERVHNLAGKTSLLTSLATLAGASYVISGDSFPAHACDLLGVPATILFGATSPYFGFAPCSENIIVRHLNLSCSPCTRHGRGLCRFRNLMCLNGIAPHEVADDALQALERTKMRHSR